MKFIIKMNVSKPHKNVPIAVLLYFSQHHLSQLEQLQFHILALD